MSSTAQHGVKRTRIDPTPDTEAVQLAKREKEFQKINHYIGLVNQLYAAVRALPVTSPLSFSG